MGSTRIGPTAGQASAAAGNCGAACAGRTGEEARACFRSVVAARAALSTCATRTAASFPSSGRCRRKAAA
jgi:hypothetical protein